MNSELIEFFILIFVAGVLGILAIYTYKSILEIKTALVDLLELQGPIEELKLLGVEIGDKLSGLKNTLELLQNAFNTIQNIFKGIFEVLAVIIGLVSTTCSMFKGAGKALTFGLL
jgi:hypothetical protein